MATNNIFGIGNTNQLDSLNIINYFRSISREKSEILARKQKAPIFRKSSTKPGFYVVTYVNGDKVYHTLFKVSNQNGSIKNNQGRDMALSLTELKSNIQRIINQSLGIEILPFDLSNRYMGQGTEDDAFSNLFLLAGKPVYFKDPFGSYKVAFFHINDIKIQTLDPSMLHFQSAADLDSWVDSKISSRGNGNWSNNNPQGGRRKTLRRKNRKNRTRKY